MAFRIPSSCRYPFWIDVASGSCLALGFAFLMLTGAILRKSLGAPDWLISVAVALPMASQILSLAWAGASHQRRKVPFFSAGAYLMGALIILAAFSSPILHGLTGPDFGKPILFGATPEALVFFFLSLLAFFAGSGFNVLLTSVYRRNYAVDLRARIVSRINVFKFLAALPVAVGVAIILEYTSGSGHVWFLALGGLVTLVSGLIYLKQTVAGEENFCSGLNRPELRRRIVPQNLIGLLRRNPHFLRYQICQTFHGSGNLICMPAFLMLLVDQDKWNLGYAEVLIITTVVPNIGQIISSMLWAPLIDRLSPSKARTFNSPFWIVGWLAVGIGAFTSQVWTAYLARASAGLAMGGSRLIWALGSLHYSQNEDPSELVAAHSFLTGLRGLVFPLIGGLLYAWVGNWVFFVGAFMMTLAAVGYYFQDRAEQRDPDFVAERDGAAAEPASVDE